MRAVIVNFRGIHHAAIDLDGLTLVTGPNGVGKTSIAQAVACALTGQPLPIDGLRKTDAGVLVRTGAAAGEIVLAGTDGHTQVTWPDAKVYREGRSPQATAIAAGLDHLVDHKPGDRAALMHRYLKAEPTRDDLAEALPDIEPALIDKVWKRIDVNSTGETNGWDIAHEEARQKGAKLKGQWEHASGAGNYGSKKAASWVPADWDEGLATASEESLNADLAREREFLEAQIGTDAINQDERRRLQEQAEGIGDAEASLEEAETAVATVETELDEARAARASLPPNEVNTSLPCPHCSQAVQIKKSGAATWLEKATTENLSDKEKKDRLMAIARADGRVENRKAAVAEAQQEHQKAVGQVQGCRDAIAQLADLPPEPATDSRQVEDGRERVRRAEARLAAFKAWRNATRIHQQIEVNAKVVAALAKDGVRRTVTARALKQFVNDRLLPLCRRAGWPDITFNEGLEPHLGGRVYGLLSESEQYRVRVLIQIAMAQTDGSDLLVIDGVDVLDRAGRNALMKVLRSAGVRALLAMTTEDQRRNPPPDLQALKLGRTYWVDGGEVQPWPLAQQKAA